LECFEVKNTSSLVEVIGDQEKQKGHCTTLA